MTANLLKQAAPANVSTRDRLIGALSGSRIPEQYLETKQRVETFPGAACFHTVRRD
jgi:hypothetical protein